MKSSEINPGFWYQSNQSGNKVQWARVRADGDTVIDGRSLDLVEAGA